MANQNKINTILDIMNDLQEKLLSLPTDIARTHMEVTI